jgi:hypothetical protein
VLKALGISAEAVLVNQGGADGVSARIPSPGHFNHVVVRAQIGANAYWLDGTLFSSPKFANLPQPNFRAALPLRFKGADLESVSATPFTSPELLEVVDIDASAGIDKPARISVRKVVHGADVIQLRAGLASLAGEDLKRTLRSLGGFGTGNSETEETNWTYDESTGALSVTWAGTQKLDWEDGSEGGKTYYIPGAGFTPPNELQRPKEQDQSAPWNVDFPYFKCWITTIRLPPDQGRLRWSYSSDAVNRTLGGVQYFREATIQKGVVQTVMSRRAIKAELSAQEAGDIATALPKFNNDKSYIYQYRSRAGNSDDLRPVLETKAIDWISSGKLCQPPSSK